MKTVHIGECHHLFNYDIDSDDCLKRYFKVYDYRNGEIKRLAFCNDFFRLKIAQSLKNKKHDKYYSSSDSYGRYEIVYELVMEAIGNYLSVDDTNKWHLDNVLHKSKDMASRDSIVLPLCDRPFVCGRFEFREVFDMLDNDWVHYDIMKNIEDGVRNALLQKINYATSVVYLKGLHKEAYFLKSQLCKSHYNWDIGRMVRFFADVIIKTK